MNPINIIGIGQGKEDLTPKHLEMIKICDVLVGGRRHLKMFDSDLSGFDYSKKDKIFIEGPIVNLIELIKEKMCDQNIVVLASGDPLFYGIGSTLIKYLKKDQLNIHSNISSVSAAFAAIKEPWHDAKIISLHGKLQDSFCFAKLAHENKVAFLTDPQRTPQHIARKLITAGIHNFKFYVLENLGNKGKQRITQFEDLDLIAGEVFSQPNIVILKKIDKKTKRFSHETHIGMKDSLFKHSKGLITKSEVRTISLSKLKLVSKKHVLWDIGAGSGSVSIEASLLNPWGHVYAMEKHPDRIFDISQNIKNFNCSNIKVLNTTFPDGIEQMKAPDRIFIGGGGQNLGLVIKTACDKLCDFGIIVINTVLLQNLETAVKVLKENNFNPDVVQIQVSRSKQMPFGDRFEALNPVWIISGSKPEIVKPKEETPTKGKPDK